MSNKEPKKPLTDEEISKDILSGEGKAGRIEHDGSFVSVSEVRRLLNIAESEARASERERIRAVLEKLKAPEAKYMMLKHRHRNKIIDEALKAIGGE